MSWISPTFGDVGEPSQSAEKKRRVMDAPASSFVTTSSTGSEDDWHQKYCPKSVDQLAVNSKKLNELESWLQQSFANKSSKFLLLTGPSGCGKTTALQVLCRKLNLTIREWITPLDKHVYESDFISRTAFPTSNAKQFEDYLFQSSRYDSCLSFSRSRKIVLVKDFPNIFIHTPAKFHEAIDNLVGKCISPVVFICNDDVICRNLFPSILRESCGIQTINVNPIPDQKVVKVLKNVVQQECKINKSVKMLPDDSLYIISSACQGDLRSAISKLRFSTINSSFDISELKCPSKIKKSKRPEEPNITEKDVKLDFFRGIGRVLYPKKIDTKECLTFVHSTSDIVGAFLSEPNNLLNQLFENYPWKLGNVYDISNAAQRLANSDMLMTRWQDKDIFHTYSLSVAVQGLMVSNKNPQKTKFEAFKKSQTSRVESDSKSLQLEGKRMFSDLYLLDYEGLLDILPFANCLLPNLSSSQLDYLRKVCCLK